MSFHPRARGRHLADRELERVRASMGEMPQQKSRCPLRASSRGAQRNSIGGNLVGVAVAGWRASGPAHADGGAIPENDTGIGAARWYSDVHARARWVVSQGLSFSRYSPTVPVRTAPGEHLFRVFCDRLHKAYMFYRTCRAERHKIGFVRSWPSYAAGHE
jgi:hypothetical protein